MDKDLIVYKRTSDFQESPSTWEPDHVQSKRAHNAFRALLRRGAEIALPRQKQVLILKWFESDEKNCYAAGFENGFSELIMDPEFQEAIGFSANSPGQMSKMVFLFELGEGYLNMNLLGPGRSKAAEATRVLRDKKKAVDNAETPEEKAAAMTDLRETTEDILDKSVREVREMQRHRPPICTARKLNGKIALSADDEIMLYVSSNVSAGAARVISALCGGRGYLRYLWDKDGIWSVDPETGEIFKVATWAKPFDDAIMEALAEAIPGCQRRIT